MDASNPTNISRLSALCGLTSFVVNNHKNIFRVDRNFTPAEVSVLASLLDSGAEIEYLTFYCDLLARTVAELGSAIRRSGWVNDLNLCIWGVENGPMPTPELVRLVAAAPIMALEQLKIRNLTIDEGRTTQMCDSLAASPRLRSLTIENCKLSAPPFARQIYSFRTLESLEISRGDFRPEDIEMILVGMRDLPAVADLTLKDVEVGAGGWRELGGLLCRISRRLNLTNTHLGDRGISAIADVVIASGRKKLRLQELRLSGNNFRLTVGVQKLAGLVARSPYLRRLSLWWNRIIGGPADIVGRCANSLEVLDISECGLSPQETALLLARDCHALTVLNMDHNRVGDVGAGAVAQFILQYHGGCKLRDLCMDENGIGEAGALELAKGLDKAYAIRSISMGGNPLGPRGASAVLSALATVSVEPMDTINFRRCKAGDDGASAAGKIITHRGCRCLFLTENNIHVGGAKAIADSVKVSASVIESLHLLDNPLGDEGVKYLLCGIMQRDRFVRELGIDLSGIGVEGAMAVKQVTKTACALRDLTCGGMVQDKEAKKILLEAQDALVHSSKSEGAVTLIIIGVIWGC